MSDARDFDFLLGTWTSRQRRRRKWLAGSEEWDDFEATIDARPILDGLGTVEEFRTDYAGGFVGVTFRFFDPASGEWSIYWADTRYPARLDPPVVGSFSGGVGVFECDDSFEGRPIRVRYTWSNVATPAPRWEQAFSDDGGTTWETNWVADFTRLG
ncbi:MAG TPA: hypothetical protein VFB94_21210 [Acidimicrobiales bacterium]|nr:hypothetical protein [Acidimicrobiales bacterium]